MPLIWDETANDYVTVPMSEYINSMWASAVAERAASAAPEPATEPETGVLHSYIEFMERERQSQVDVPSWERILDSDRRPFNYPPTPDPEPYVPVPESAMPTDDEVPHTCTCSACDPVDSYDDDSDDDDYQDYGPYDDDSSDNNGSRYIYDHYYKPTPVFHGEGPRFMGFELETAMEYGTVGRSADLVVNSLGDLVYLKEDGSISNGFEIVTHPMSYDYAISSFPWGALDEFQRAGIGPDDSTGLHIHINRDGFTGKAHTYRWMKFIYRNQRQVEKIARRSSTEWAQFAPEHRRGMMAHLKGQETYNYGGIEHYTHGGRYTAINTTNYNTLEMRVFASTVDAQELQSALALVDASAAYTAQIDAAAVIKDHAWSWSAFREYVNSEDKYAPLSREMRKLSCV